MIWCMTSTKRINLPDGIKYYGMKDVYITVSMGHIRDGDNRWRQAERMTREEKEIILDNCNNVIIRSW